jgi:hypothetical protein
MSLMIVAAMMMAQAPAAAQPVATAAPAAKKQKPAQVCEYIELTGSRSKRRVCRDANGDLDLGPGIRSGSVDNQSKIQDSSTSATPGGSN